MGVTYTSSHTSGHWERGKWQSPAAGLYYLPTLLSNQDGSIEMSGNVCCLSGNDTKHKLCEYCHFRELECQLRNLGYHPQRPTIRPSSPFGPLQPAPKSPIFWSYRYSVNTANHAHYMPEDQTMKTKTCLQQHAPLPCPEFRLVHCSSIENLRKHRILCLDYQIRGAVGRLWYY